eukprot:8231605-Ditylum_brightwellii.AAC.1
MAHAQRRALTGALKDFLDLVDGVDAFIPPKLSSSSLGNNAGTFMSGTDAAATTPDKKKVKSSTQPSSVSLPKPFSTTEEQQQ